VISLGRQKDANRQEEQQNNKEELIRKMLWSCGFYHKERKGQAK